MRLCWYWKIWKTQGQTIRCKVGPHLDMGEKQHGLSYVDMSRVTRFPDIGLYEGITYNHLCKSIQKHKIMTPSINAEKRFHTLLAIMQQFLRNL